ncbi:MAG: squalene--hopene cyclase [Pirellulales bacterium]|nr:squalene--hopene cyclase [Pirellulales bacterium]
MAVSLPELAYGQDANVGGAFSGTPFVGGEWEITPDSEAALERGLAWLARNQGAEGNWESNDVGLVSMGALAFMAAGHAPGRGKYGPNVERALNYVIKHAKPSGLLNASNPQRDMYNHGLACFVLGQAYGISNDQRIGPVLERALRLIANTQCGDGGWDYIAKRQDRGHDLSLVVMQAKALRSAMDSGFEVSPDTVRQAISCVRAHYTPQNRQGNENEERTLPGQFTYNQGGQGTIAMAACGVVCLQEFGQYDDWRIFKSMEFVNSAIKRSNRPESRDGVMPFDSYTLYYVGQALYQVGGQHWREGYPILRDQLVAAQVHEPGRDDDGKWQDRGRQGESRIGGKPGELYGTSVACFILAIPNRYLPILQDGKISQFQKGN